MNLLDTLACGVRSARNGSAYVYARGTTTEATVYADFEGKVRRGQPVQLDSYGAVNAYVSELVDVVVSNVDDIAVRSFTDGSSDRATEVVSPSITGADYDTAVAGVSEPTTLERALASVVSSFGGTDFNVLAGSASLTLQAAFYGLSGVFVNVKDAAYVATGDGVTDDYVACQSAINAAYAQGGGTVYFPPGTYLVSSNLTLPSTVSLMGAGPNASAILQTTFGRATLYVYANPYTGSVSVTGLRFGAYAASSGDCLYIDGSAKVAFYNCDIGGANSEAVLARVLASTSFSRVSFTACRFTFGGTTASARAVYSQKAAGTGRITLHDCVFVAPATCASTGIVYGPCVHLRSCKFDLSATIAGSFSCVAHASTAWGSADCCEFVVSAAVPSFFNLGTLAGAASWFWEDGSVFATTVAAFLRYMNQDSSSVGTVGTADVYYCKFGSRKSRVTEVTAITASNIAPMNGVSEAGVFCADISGAGAVNFTMSLETEELAGTGRAIPYGEKSIFFLTDSAGSASLRLVGGGLTDWSLTGGFGVYTYGFPPISGIGGAGDLRGAHRAVKARVSKTQAWAGMFSTGWAGTTTATTRAGY